MTQSLQEALKEAVLESDDTFYVIVRLAANGILAASGVLAQIAEPFSAIIVDRHEVSLIMPEELVADFSPRFREFQVSAERYRLITFDVTLDFSLVGFMAHVSAALAAAGIPIMPYAAYTRDHLLVPADKFDLAMDTLRALKAQA